VVIVIVNWNKRNDVITLLTSLEGICYDNFEIVIVDNASTDGSVEAIRQAYPDLQVLINSENLGGTGGFNTGLRFAIAKGDYKYIWLLDNDVEVDEASLLELVKIMEADQTIGIAGSRIVDSAKREVTIEAGSFFRWDTIEVNPLFRNEKEVDTSNTIYDVDYVALCSALVRTSAIEKVGLMDERYFLFWDDMDWGLQFKKHGFRIVAVLTSIAYHPPFTEKRSIFVDFYYGYRNPLLTYAKHTRLVKRILIYFKHLRYRSKILIFWGLNDRKDLMNLGLQGIYDFVVSRWGGREFGALSHKQTARTSALFTERASKIIVLNTGNREEIYGALGGLRKLFPQARYTLLIEDDRMGIFPTGFDTIFKLRRDRQDSVLYLLPIFFKVLARNYDMAIIPNYPSPFSYAVKSACIYNPSSGTFSESNANRKNIWKLILATVIGEALGILLLPFVLMRSILYNKV